MERSGGGDREREIWGTLEELLLVCAVDRHGPQNWDSVAAEIQSRSPFSHQLTPHSCRNRYLHLRQRFSGAGEVEGEEGVFPWLDELRKLRVTELRRDVERSDRSIGSLQLKVKRLEEERARETTESGEDKPENAAEDGERSPETVAGDRISGRDSGGPSCEESNSTDPKKETNRIDDLKVEIAGDLAVPAAGDGEKVPSGVAVGEGSCNGSTEGARARVGGESGESIAESKGGEDGEDDEEEENSDVQSSASLSKRRMKAVSGSSSGGEEVEAEVGEVSKIGLAGEARPLVSFLESVRSKYGSVFNRRLEIQDSDRYRCLIRRHVDFDTLRSKIDRIGSGRSYAAVEFFRDLLLLCTNVIVFYPKNSTESRTAVHLRRLVLSEMLTALPQLKREPQPSAPASIAPAPSPSQPKIAILKPKPDPDISVAVSLLDKPSSSAPLIVCRKRSSINKVKEEKEKEKEDEKEKEKEDEKEKGSEQKVKDSEEKNLLKNTKERSLLTGTRSLRTKKKPAVNGGNAAQVMRRPVISPTPSIKTKHVESSPASELTGKAEKKSGGGSNSTSVSGKKNKPAIFLSRIKRSAAGSTLMESLKNSPPSGGSGKGLEHKKGSKSGGDNRKEQGGSLNTGTGSKKMVAVADESNSKRTVGRPPKRMAPLPTPPPAKRAKEETESSKNAASKKRGRR